MHFYASSIYLIFYRFEEYIVAASSLPNLSHLLESMRSLPLLTAEAEELGILRSRGVHSRHLLTSITAVESLTHEAVALIAEEFFIDEAEELEIGFLPKFLLFTYVGLIYWSTPPCVLRGVHRWLPLHRPCALRGVLSPFAITTSSLCLSRSTFSASIYWSTCVFSVPLRSYTLAR